MLSGANFAQSGQDGKKIGAASIDWNIKSERRRKSSTTSKEKDGMLKWVERFFCSWCLLFSVSSKSDPVNELKTRENNLHFQRKNRIQKSTMKPCFAWVLLILLQLLLQPSPVHASFYIFNGNAISFSGCPNCSAISTQDSMQVSGGIASLMVYIIYIYIKVHIK